MRGRMIRRVIIVVLDGLRPDAIDEFDRTHTRRLFEGGASSLCATTVAPSVTAAAMASLLTGVSPSECQRRSRRRDGSHRGRVRGIR